MIFWYCSNRGIFFHNSLKTINQCRICLLKICQISSVGSNLLLDRIICIKINSTLQISLLSSNRTLQRTNLWFDTFNLCRSVLNISSIYSSINLSVNLNHTEIISIDSRSVWSTSVPCCNLSLFCFSNHLASPVYNILSIICRECSLL